MNDETELSSDEKAYFDTKGNPPVVEKEPEAEIEQDEETELSAETDSGEGEEPAKPEKVRTVPHQALHAERTKRQEVERQLAAERDQRARLDERVRLINEAIQRQNQPEPPKPPALEEDPLGYIKHIEQRLETTEQQRQREAQERQQSEQVARLDNAYRSDWADFMQKTPDAVDAYTHITTVLDKHFQMRGVADPMQRQQLVMNEEREIALAAFRDGKSPAQVIYEQAKFYGYAPKAAAQTAQDGGQKAIDQIERRQKAMPAARSLSSAGGGGGEAAITAETLANMDEADFNDMLSKLSPAKQRALFGG